MQVFETGEYNAEDSIIVRSEHGQCSLEFSGISLEACPVDVTQIRALQAFLDPFEFILCTLALFA